MSVRISEVSAEQTYELRNKVLRPGQPIESCQYLNDNLSETFHLAAIFEDRLVGIITVEPDSYKDFSESPQFRIRGMAVLPDCRRLHIGAKLVVSAMSRLKEKAVPLVWFNAREVAFKFYEHLGFRYHGEVFDIEGIGPHKVMYATVKGWSYEESK